jgi:hypothetical protein
MLFMVKKETTETKIKKTKTKTKEQDNSINGLINDYLDFLFKILLLIPMNFNLIKKFFYGKFTREDYDKNFKTNLIPYFQSFLIYVVSSFVGVWWLLLFLFLLLPFLIGIIPTFPTLGLGVILMGIIFTIVLIISIIVFGVVFIYLKSWMYKYVIEYFKTNITFNEANTLVIYSSILYFLIMVPFVLSNALLIGLFISSFTIIIPFYVLYFVYQELVNKFNMEEKKAFHAVVVTFILEMFLVFGMLIAVYAIMILLGLLGFSIIPFLL